MHILQCVDHTLVLQVSSSPCPGAILMSLRSGHVLVDPRNPPAHSPFLEVVDVTPASFIDLRKGQLICREWLLEQQLL